MGLPRENRSVDGDPVARPDAHPVARPDLPGRDEAIRVSLDPDDLLGSHCQEGLDRTSRPPLGQGFEIASQQNDRDHHGLRVEVDVAVRRGEERREEGDQGAVKEGGARPGHHEAVHVRGEVAVGGEPRPEEASPRPEKDGGREKKLEKVEHEGFGAGKKVEKSPPQRGNHREQKDRQRQKNGQRKGPSKLPERFPPFRTPSPLPFEQDCGMARPGQNVENSSGGQIPREPGDLEPVLGRKRQNGKDRRKGAKGRHDPVFRGPVDQGLHIEVSLFGKGRVAGLLHRRGQSPWRSPRGIEGDGGAIGGEIDANPRHARNLSQGLLDPAGAGGAGHPQYGKLDFAKLLFGRTGGLLNGRRGGRGL